MARPLLSKLLEYSSEHFEAEEKLLEAAGYPQLPEHRLQHFAMTDKARDLVVRLDAGGRAVNVELLFFLGEWLQGHILHDDKAYGPWLIGRGVHGKVAEELCAG